MREFEIERQFQIKIDIIKANKGVYYLKTNKGERCLWWVCLGAGFHAQWEALGGNKDGHKRKDNDK